MKLRIISILDRILRAVCAFLMGAMTLTVILSVLFRYVFRLTAVWSEELITILFIATTFLGTAMVSRDNEHISIDYIYEKVSPRIGRFLRILVSFVTITVMLVVFRYSLIWIAVNANLKTTGLDLPFRWMYSLLPLSCVLVSLIETGKVINAIRDFLMNTGVRPDRKVEQ